MTITACVFVHGVERGIVSQDREMPGKAGFVFMSLGKEEK